MKEEIKVKNISKYAYNIAIAMGFIILLINLICFFAWGDSLNNKNAISSILIILVSSYLKGRSDNK